MECLARLTFESRCLWSHLFRWLRQEGHNFKASFFLISKWGLDVRLSSRVLAWCAWPKPWVQGKENHKGEASFSLQPPGLCVGSEARSGVCSLKILRQLCMWGTLQVQGGATHDIVIRVCLPFLVLLTSWRWRLCFLFISSTLLIVFLGSSPLAWPYAVLEGQGVCVLMPVQLFIGKCCFLALSTSQN